MTGKQRRKQLIDSAIALFGQHGFKGTTTKADLYASVFQDRLSVGKQECR